MSDIKTAPENITALVDVKTIAELIGMSSRFVYQSVEQGTIPARRIGNSIRFDVAEVLAWVESRRLGPKPKAQV